MLIFENKGEVVGVSNPHPHGQIYATNFVFKTIETEAAASRRYYDEHHRVLFQDILRSEQEDGRRILFENASAVAFLPYFARYAYECYVAPKEAHASLATMSAGELRELAAALKSLLVRYDNLWQMSFPYVLTLHQAPTDGADYSGFHFHIECHPPLRKPNLLKYLAGPEIGGGNFLSDTRPEAKAAELLAVPDVHYRHAVIPAALLNAAARAARRRARRDRGRDGAPQPGGAGLDRSRPEGDTIYAIDVVAEAIVTRFAERLAREHPFVLVAEGLPGGRRGYPAGVDETSADWWVIVDPIDGTRGLMYQKRSAWILTAVAPNRGPGTSLSDIELAVQTEIPLVKQHLSDQLWALRGGGAHAQRFNRLTGERVPIRLRPSAASGIAHGYATIARFFPGARDELAAIDEAIVRGALGPHAVGKGPLLRGSVRLDRRSAVRADGRARPLHRGPPAASPPGAGRPRAAAGTHVPSLRHLLRAHRGGERRDRDRSPRPAARRAVERGGRGRVGGVRERAHSRTDRAAAAAGASHARVDRERGDEASRRSSRPCGSAACSSEVPRSPYRAHPGGSTSWAASPITRGRSCSSARSPRRHGPPFSDSIARSWKSSASAGRRTRRPWRRWRRPADR